MSQRENCKRNLELAGLFDKDSDYDGMLGKAVMKLIDTHFDEGHSGASHEMAVELFYRVAKGKALTAKYWDERKKQLDDFAAENMGEPWKDHIVEELIGKRPNEKANT